MMIVKMYPELFEQVTSSASEIDYKTSFIPIQRNISNYLFVGASITYLSFDPIETKTLIDSTFGVSSTVYNRAVGGRTLDELELYIDTILSDYTETEMIVFVHIGGNNVSAESPFSDLTETRKDELRASIDNIINSIKTKGYIPVLSDISFRTNHYDSEELSAKPFNDYIWKPKILEHCKEFAYEDGTSVFSFYNFTYNNPTVVNGYDYTHPTDNGASLIIKRFVDTVCYQNYLGIKPDRLDKMKPFNYFKLSKFKVSFGSDDILPHLDTENINLIGEIGTTTLISTDNYDMGVQSSIDLYYVTGSGAVTGNNSGFLLDTQLRHNVYFSPTQTLTLTLSGLSNYQRFKFRTSGRKEGATQLRETNVTINGYTKSYVCIESDGTPNVDDGVEFTNIAPTNGEITVVYTCKSGDYGYVGGFDLMREI